VSAATIDRGVHLQKGEVPDEFNVASAKRRPSTSLPQATPLVAVIDPETCAHFRAKCKAPCADVCEREAIDFEQKEEIKQLRLARSSWRPVQSGRSGQGARYGYGKYPNVFSSLEIERMSTPPDRAPVKSSCGRAANRKRSVSCTASAAATPHQSVLLARLLYVLAQARPPHQRADGAEVYNFYIDMRTPVRDTRVLRRLLEKSPLHSRPRAEINDWATEKTEQANSSSALKTR